MLPRGLACMVGPAAPGAKTAAAGGSSAWRRDPRLMRTFSWLTVLWGVVWIVKVGVQGWLWHLDETTATELGVARLLLGYPPYALLLAFTVWWVRRTHPHAVLAGEPTAPA